MVKCVVPEPNWSHRAVVLAFVLTPPFNYDLSTISRVVRYCTESRMSYIQHRRFLHLLHKRWPPPDGRPEDFTTRYLDILAALNACERGLRRVDWR